MKSNLMFRNALKTAAMAAVAGPLFQATILRAQVVTTYFPLTVSTTTDGSDTFTAYFQGRQNDGIKLGTEEYGAQVSLVRGLPSTVLKGISFYYFSDFSAVGAISYRLYENDGPLVSGFASPLTTLVDSTMDLDGNASGIVQKVTLDFSYDALNRIETPLTFTIQIAGLDGTHHAGMITSDAATSIGSHPMGFWQTFDNATTWQLGSFINVPEVNGFAVVGAALLVFGVARKIRRSDSSDR